MVDLESEGGAEGEIRTREFLRNRDLNPTPLTWLGNLRNQQGFLESAF